MSPERRILIVDDEKTIADTLKAIFARVGYTAQAAYSAEQALPLIADWNPQLVIVDVRLPGMNGIDLAMKVKAEFPGSKTVLFSGDGSVADVLEQARQQGHKFEVLAKPVPPDLFLDIAAVYFGPGRALVAGTA